MEQTSFLFRIRTLNYQWFHFFKLTVKKSATVKNTYFCILSLKQTEIDFLDKKWTFGTMCEGETERALEKALGRLTSKRSGAHNLLSRSSFVHKRKVGSWKSSRKSLRETTKPLHHLVLWKPLKNSCTISPKILEFRWPFRKTFCVQKLDIFLVSRQTDSTDQTFLA